jgi:uncharacterized protein (DUF433 family)
MPAWHGISETPGINGGYPVIEGTRTPVRTIVVFHRQGAGIQELAELLPHLTVEEIRGALAYYALAPARVDEDIARNAKTLAELQSRPWPV